MRKRTITIPDLCRFKIINDPQISPDGKFVVFSIQIIDQEKNCYRSRLFRLDMASGEFCQFTRGDVYDHHPRWSPDGCLIAFKRTKSGDTQIWLIRTHGGEAWQLTDMDEGVFGSFSWSPDGRWIAYEYRQIHPEWSREAHQRRNRENRSNPPRIIKHFHYRREGVGFLDFNQQIWIHNLADSQTQMITEGNWDVREPVWSPNGTLALISNRDNNPDLRPYHQDVWIVPENGGGLQKVPSPLGYKRGLSWSPDGANLAYVGAETKDDPWGARNDRVWILSLRDGSTRCLTKNLDRNAGYASISDLQGSGNQYPIWMPDGRGLFFLVSDRGSCHLYQVRFDAEPEIVIAGDLDITGFSLDISREQLVVLAGKPRQPAEIFTFRRGAGKTITAMTSLSQVNKQLLSEIQLGEPEEVWIDTVGNHKVQGWLLKPPLFDAELRYPLVFYIHGGPAAQYAKNFFHEFQVLAAQGYLVFYTNPRGSLGREEDFARCIEGDWGNLDYNDLMDAIAYVEARPYVDKNRMAVIGGSYGGFMVTWIIGYTDRFCCAVSERAVSNRHSAVGTSDFPPMPDGYWSGNSWDQPEELWAQSTLRLAGNIHTPLLLIHSEGDLRCPIGQAEQLYSALKRLDQDVTFLRYPPETGHDMSREGPPDLRLDRMERIVAWLEGYLK